MTLTIPRRIIATLAATTILAGLGGATANAANTTSLTISPAQGQSLDGQTFHLYRIGDYKDIQTDQNGNVTGLTVTSPTGLDATIQAANQTGGVADSPDIDAAGDLARTKDALALNKTAQTLAGQTTKLGTPIDLTGKGDGPITADDTTVPAGYYLMVNDRSTPVLVGTRPNGKPFTGTGAVTAKLAPTTVKTMTANKPSGETDGDHDSATVGSTQTFTIERTVPNALSFKGFTVEDLLTNMTVVNKTDGKPDITVTAKDGTPITTGYTITQGVVTPATTFTLTADDTFVKAWSGRQIVITYKVWINKASRTVENNGVISNKVDGVDTRLDGTDIPADPVTVPVETYGLTLHKTSLDRTANLAGAEFKIKYKDGGWLQCTPNGLVPNTPTIGSSCDWWGQTISQDRALPLTTDNNGAISLTGLASGTYTIVETKAPAGHVNINLPTFDATIDDNGTVTVTPANGTTLVDTTLDKTGRITVRNIDSITQLPQTGAVGIGITLAAATILIGLGLTIRTLRRRHGIQAA